MVMYTYIQRSGVLITWILALIPVGLFVASGEMQIKSLYSLYRVLGQLCGILGLSLFAINFILSARFRFLDNLFAGLDKSYQAHHKLGAYAFVFILLHPTFLALQYLGVSPSAVVLFLQSGITDFAVVWGELAIAIVFIILFITFYIRLRYENWKAIHRWIGLGLLCAGLHIYLIPSTTARFAPLRWYMIGLVLVGIFCWLYSLVIRRYTKHNFTYVVTEVVRSSSIVQIHMEPKDRVIQHFPGQFGFFTFDSDKQSHPFSFTSVGNTGKISIAVKAVGDYTLQLQSVQIGAKVNVEAPYGKFGRYALPNYKQIWVAGGIGVTPFISMVKNLTTISPETILWLSVKNENDSPFITFFQQLSHKIKSFSFHVVYTDQQGYITASQILRNQKVQECQIYLCGPIPMMKSLIEQFVRAGVPRKHIYFEDFNLLTI